MNRLTTGICALISATMLIGLCPAVFAQDKQVVTPDAPGAKPATPGVEELLQQAESAMAKIKDYTGFMDKQERFLEELGKIEKMQFKFSLPFKVYIKFLNVYNGREAIFVRGKNDNEVKVHKGSFPDITLNLDTKGDTAMEGNHHPITDFGLGSTIRISARNLRKALKRGDCKFEVSDGGMVNGRPVWKIAAKFPKGGSFVTAKDDETLWDIAKRTGQDMFLILYTNKDKGWDEPDDIDEGDKVFVPRYYGGRAELMVDKETHLPVKATTWDWAGKLYETYSYKDIKLNVGLSPKDFDPDNKGYDF